MTEPLGFAPPWVEVVPDRCCCKWLNGADEGGWVLVQRRPHCPVHGDAPADDDAVLRIAAEEGGR